MKVKEVAEALERFAPLPLQESYDNAGLQIGLTEAEASGVLLCLDVTEDVIREAAERGCNMVVAHHPLLFRGVKQVTDATLVERCLREAILCGVAVYAAHTNLDNVAGGVNWKIAEKIGLQDVKFLQPMSDGQGGSGIIGTLPHPEAPMDFLKRTARCFGTKSLAHNLGPDRPIEKVALCGGAGDFLLDEAVRQGADVFLTGEMSYHRYFGMEQKIWIGTLGHYESEQFTVELMGEILQKAFPKLPVLATQTDTNPIHHLCAET